MALRKVPLEDRIERPIIKREAQWRLHDALGQVALFFPQELVGKFVPRVEAYLLREEFTSSARVDLFVYRVVSWYRNGFQLRSVFRRPVLQDWPTPPRQMLVSVVRDGVLPALQENVAIYATQKAGEIWLYHKDAETGRNLVHYLVSTDKFLSGQCSLPRDIAIPGEGEEVLVSQDGTSVLLCREALEIYQAVTDENGFQIVQAKSHMDKEMARELLGMVDQYDRSDLPGPEAIAVYGVVPASIAAVVPYMTNFRLTEEAETDIRTMLPKPRAYRSPCDGKIVDFRQVPEGCRLTIVGDGQRFSLTLPPTFVADDNLSEDGVTVQRGQVIGYSWPASAAYGELNQELIAAVFRDFWKPHPSDSSLRLIRLDYLPSTMWRSVLVHKNGIPLVFWRIAAPVVAIKMEVCDSVVAVGSWQLNLSRPDKKKEEAGRKG